MVDPFRKAAADVFGSVLCRDATFTPAAGDPVACRAGLSRNLELTDTYGTVIEVAIAITLPRAAVGLPSNGDEVAIGADTYRVDRIITYDDHTVMVSCSHG